MRLVSSATTTCTSRSVRSARNVRSSKFPIGVATRYGVQAVLTLLFFKGGQVQETKIGARGKRDLLAKLDALA